MDIDPQGAPVAPPQPPAGDKPQSGGSNKNLKIIIGVVLGVAVLGWLGQMLVGKMVSFGMRKAIEAGTGVKINDQGGSVSFKGKNGEQVTYNVNGENGGTVTYKDVNGATGEIQVAGGDQAKTLPKNFPSDFPVMSDLKLASTYYAAEGGKTTFVISWTTAKSVDDVSAYYKTAMTDNGWTSESSADYNGTQILSYSKNPQPDGTKDTAQMTVSAENGETTLSLMMQRNAAQ